MRHLTLKLIVIASALCVSSAIAGPQDLATKYNCMGCHAIDKKLVGPAYKDVAAKYKGKGAEADLVKKIKAGGSGVWGAIPMPPNAAPESELRQIVDWVLTQ
jgi:cytochrome c